MDPNSASAGAPKSGKDKDKKSKKNYEDGDGKKKFVSVLCYCVSLQCEASGCVCLKMLESGCLLNSEVFNIRVNFEVLHVANKNLSLWSFEVLQLER